MSTLAKVFCAFFPAEKQIKYAVSEIKRIIMLFSHLLVINNKYLIDP